VPLPGLTVVELGVDPSEALSRTPAAAGVGQLLGPGGRNLLLAPASNLRRWASAHLGRGKPPPPGRRPKTNLSGIATSLVWARTANAFAQKLLYERLAAPLIPLAERRDLRPPAFLHLDPAERFPRVTVRGTPQGSKGLFGPFPSRRAAERARDAANHLFSLRPCDSAFEPDPDLPLGLGCLYAQVRSCAAPCLSRLSEEDYRALAARAAAWLADPGERENAPASVPPAVGRAEGALALVVGVGRRELELYPVREGRVLDDAMVSAPPDQIDVAVRGLQWPASPAPADWPWLAAWIASPRGRGTYIPVGDPDDRASLAAAVRHALPPRFARPSSGDGDNVGSSRGRG
jgi:hypothetical protein